MCSRPVYHWIWRFCQWSDYLHKCTKETTLTILLLQLIVSLEADQLETEQQEPAHGQFGSKHLTSMNADVIRRTNCT